MNRTEGLVQRRVAQAANTNSNRANHDIRNGESDPLNQASLSGDNDDSKETRFTLMEEVLLLGLKDKEVTCSFKHIQLYDLC